VLPVVRLAKAGLVTSRLAFGTSRLHYLWPGERQRLLAAAADLGFVHFDTAPAYGDGLAEVELGHLLARRRDRFIIATKYGILPDPIIERWSRTGPILRVARAVARRAGFWGYRLPTLTAAGLRDSIESSLRRLKTDWIDLLLLHEPSLGRLSSPGEILNQLKDLKNRGFIRAFGLAGAWSGIEPLIVAEPELGQVVQTAESEWPDATPPEITYGVITGASQSYLRNSLGADVAVKRLRGALSRRPNGVIIVSSTKIPHLQLLAEVTREWECDR
jgi:D-threo-aldose 1-dehydrogenase